MCFLRFACNNTDSQSEQRLPVFRGKKVTLFPDRSMSHDQKLHYCLYCICLLTRVNNLPAGLATFVLILNSTVRAAELMELFPLDD